MRWQNATMLGPLEKLVLTTDPVKGAQESRVLSSHWSPDDGRRISFQNKVLKLSLEVLLLIIRVTWCLNTDRGHIFWSGNM
jgi:hypothetical protein